MDVTDLWEETQRLVAGGQRWGQAMFNALPSDISGRIVAVRQSDTGLTSVDPYEIKSLPAIKAWVAIHLMVSDSGWVEGVW